MQSVPYRKYFEIMHLAAIMHPNFERMRTLPYSGADFWQNRGFNDKSVKTSKIVHFDLLNKIGYGPIA